MICSLLLERSSPGKIAHVLYWTIKKRKKRRKKKRAFFRFVLFLRVVCLDLFPFFFSFFLSLLGGGGGGGGETRRGINGTVYMANSKF